MKTFFYSCVFLTCVNIVSAMSMDESISKMQSTLAQSQGNLSAQDAAIIAQCQKDVSAICSASPLAFNQLRDLIVALEAANEKVYPLQRSVIDRTFRSLLWDALATSNKEMFMQYGIQVLQECDKVSESIITQMLQRLPSLHQQKKGKSTGEHEVERKLLVAALRNVAMKKRGIVQRLSFIALMGDEGEFKSLVPALSRTDGVEVLHELIEKSASFDEKVGYCKIFVNYGMEEIAYLRLLAGYVEDTQNYIGSRIDKLGDMESACAAMKARLEKERGCTVKKTMVTTSNGGSYTQSQFVQIDKEQVDVPEKQNETVKPVATSTAPVGKQVVVPGKL